MNQSAAPYPSPLVGEGGTRREAMGGRGGDHLLDRAKHMRSNPTEAEREVDGSQHIDSAADARRTAWLESQGFRVLRFWNDGILARTDQVADAIWHALGEDQPSLPPTAWRRVPPSNKPRASFEPARGEGFGNEIHRG